MNDQASDNSKTKPASEPVSRQKQKKDLSWWLRLLASFFTVIGGLAVGFIMGFLINFGACFKSQCNAVEEGAPIIVPLVSLLFTVPLAIVIMKARPTAPQSDPPQAVSAQPSNSMAVAGFSLTLTGLPLFYWLSVFNFFWFLGLILSLVGLAKAQKGAKYKDLALMGVIVAFASSCLHLALLYFVFIT